MAALLRSIGIQVLVLALSLGTGVLTARLLGPEGRGVFAAVTAWPLLLGNASVAGFCSALVVLLRQAPEPRAGRAIAGDALLFGLAGGTLLALVGLVVVPLSLARYEADVVLLAQLLLLGVYPTGLQVVYRQSFAGHGAYGFFDLSGLLPQLLYLASLLALVAFVPLSATLAAVALSASAGVAILLLTPAFLRLARPALDPRGWRRPSAFASFAARAAGHDLVLAFAGSVDRLILLAYVPAAELGLYVVALGFSRLLLAVQPAVGSIILSHLSRQTEAQMQVLHDCAFRFTLYGLAVLLAALFTVDRVLVDLVYGSGFAGAVPLFRILVIEAAVACLASLTTQIYMARGRPGLVSAAYAASFGVQCAALLALVPAWGASGAAWATLLGSAARLAILLAGLSLRLGLRLPRLHLDGADLSFLLARLRSARLR